jgi:hypothetical protein
MGCTSRNLLRSLAAPSPPQTPIAINLALGPLPTPTRRLLWAAEGSGDLSSLVTERVDIERDDEETVVAAIALKLHVRRQLLAQLTGTLVHCLGLDPAQKAVRAADVFRDEDASAMVRLSSAGWRAAACSTL